jgi:hypothetical protein
VFRAETRVVIIYPVHQNFETYYNNGVLHKLYEEVILIEGGNTQEKTEGMNTEREGESGVQPLSA